MTRTTDPIDLARQLLRALQPAPANDDAPEIDEDALRERARRTAERMRRSRK